MADRTKPDRLTVRVYPARDLKRCWIARIRLDDGKPLDEGRNAWITQGRSPIDAVAMAADALRLIHGECMAGDRKHRWRPKANPRAAARGQPPVPGRYCSRCKTWESRR